jgi:hypothetical protein
MRTTAARIAATLALAAPALFLGCRSKPVDVYVQPPAPEPPAPVSRNFTGLWEGRDRDGTTYTVRFAASGAEWESHVERGGAKAPYYRGTYTFSGSVLELRVLQEADPATLEWIPERGNFPRSVPGRYVGGRLSLPAFTQAEFVRKN